MNWVWRGLAGFGVFFHLVAFAFESLLWMRPEVHTRFGATAETAETLRLIFFNQGFYNLFLAIGCGLGLWLVSRKPIVGRTLVAFTCASMFGAGVILACSAPEKIGAACMQGGPPLLALIIGAKAWKAADAQTQVEASTPEATS